MGLDCNNNVCVMVLGLGEFEILLQRQLLTRRGCLPLLLCPGLFPFSIQQRTESFQCGFGPDQSIHKSTV